MSQKVDLIFAYFKASMDWGTSVRCGGSSSPWPRFAKLPESCSLLTRRTPNVCLKVLASSCTVLCSVLADDLIIKCQTFPWCQEFLVNEAPSSSCHVHGMDVLICKCKMCPCGCPGNALLRRLVRIGVLDEGKMKLDYILGLKVEDFLERRLQTQVFKLGLAKSIHHARVLIRQRHIR